MTAVLYTFVRTRNYPSSSPHPTSVHEVLARSILADGLDLVLDLDRSAGAHLVDARDGKRYLDMFTFFASSALGMNHPALADDHASAPSWRRPR